MITSLMEQFYQGNVLDDDFWSHAQFKLKVDLAVGEYQFLNVNKMTYNEVMFSQTLAEIDAVTKKIFQLEDQVYLIINKEPIAQGRAGSKVLPLILKKLNGIECLTVTSYEQITDGERSVLEQFFISTTWANVKQTRLFQGLINQDFPDRRPQFKQANLRCAPQIYLVNPRTKLIFHLYDDRGYELYFPNQESLAKFQAELLNNAN